MISIAAWSRHHLHPDRRSCNRIVHPS